MLNCWYWMWSDCCDGRRSAWHLSEIRHSLRWSHTIMTRRWVEIARHRASGSTAVMWLVHHTWRWHVTVAGGSIPWLVVSNVGPSVTQRHFTVTRCHTNCITDVKFNVTATDSRWQMTAAILMCTMFIMVTTHLTVAWRIYIFQQSATVWRHIRLMAMYRECWVPLHSVLCTSCVYWAGDVAISSCAITTTYQHKTTLVAKLLYKLISYRSRPFYMSKQQFITLWTSI